LITFFVNSFEQYSIEIKLPNKIYQTNAALPDKEYMLESESFIGVFNGDFLKGSFIFFGEIYSFNFTRNNTPTTFDYLNKKIFGLLVYSKLPLIKFQVTKGYIVVNDTDLYPSTLYSFNSCPGTGYCSTCQLNSYNYYFGSPTEGFFNYVKTCDRNYCSSSCSCSYNNGSMLTPCGGLLGCAKWTINNVDNTWNFPLCENSYYYLFSSYEIILKKISMGLKKLKTFNILDIKSFTDATKKTKSINYDFITNTVNVTNLV